MESSAAVQVIHVLLCSTAALVLVLALRLPLRRRFGARLAYGVWILVPLVLCFSLLPALPGGQVPVFSQMSPAIVPVAAAEWINQMGRRGIDVPAGLFAGWFAVATGFLLVQLSRQWSFVKSLKTPCPIGRDVWVAHATAFSPAVLGVFQPRIVVPADFTQRYTDEEQELVLEHERAHLRRHDLVANVVVLALRCVFWFHPLVHIGARYHRVDQELACDAAVMAARPDSRSAYARALLKTHLQPQRLHASCSWGSQTASILKGRITMLKTPAPGPFRVRAGAVILVSLVVVTGAAAWGAQPVEQSEPRLKSLDEILTAPAGKQLLYLVDGRKASKEEVQKIPLNAIERVEVLPQSADVRREHGDDAAYGTVNFVLRK
jgi:bla regulator protein blaR1